MQIKSLSQSMLIQIKQRIHELAKAMGYKGITVKMTKTVDEMLAEGVLEKVMVGTHVKYSVVGAGDRLSLHLSNR